MDFSNQKPKKKKQNKKTATTFFFGFGSNLPWIIFTENIVNA